MRPTWYPSYQPDRYHVLAYTPCARLHSMCSTTLHLLAYCKCSPMLQGLIIVLVCSAAAFVGLVLGEITASVVEVDASTC